MISLKEATAEKHKLAERMPFNGLMYSGRLTGSQYGEYLKSQLAIFATLENNFEFPNEGLKRVSAVSEDLGFLGIADVSTDKATELYIQYLKGLTQDDANAHIYLNYLAIMFGGQIMKEKTPGQGKMYDFENMMESANSIRAIQKDEWADEVNRGFDFMIEIFKELDDVIKN
jgi:heme oxygenase